MKRVCLLRSSTSTIIKKTRALDLALVFTTALGLAFPNLTPVWLLGRGKAPHHGATLGRTSPEDSARDSPKKTSEDPHLTYYPPI